MAHKTVQKDGGGALLTSSPSSSSEDSIKMVSRLLEPADPVDVTEDVELFLAHTPRGGG